MRTSLLVASLFGVCLAMQPAAAADVFNGVTITELEAALATGLDVKSATTKDGDKLIFAKGRSQLIAAQLVHCGGEGRCEGVRYFAIVDKKLSAAEINAFNEAHNYSKVVISSATGRTIMNVEQLTVGGVTSENLLYNALALMRRMGEIGEGEVTAALPKVSNTAELSGLIAREGFALGNRPAASLDSRLAHGLIEQAEAFGKATK